MLSVLKTLFINFYDQEIPYCIFRESAHLKEDLDGDGEIGLLVHPEKLGEAHKMMREAGFRRIMEPGDVVNRHQEHWMGFDDLTGKLVMLRIHQDILIPGRETESYVYLWRDVALRDRIPFEGTCIYVADPHLETLILYIQLAQRVTMGEDDPLFWKALCGISALSGKIRKERMAALCQELFWGNGLMISDLVMRMVMRERNFALKPPSPKELTSLMSKIEHELKPTFYKVGSREDVRRNGQESSAFGNALTNDRKASFKEGISICFIGSDGSGKTTLSEDVEKWLSEWIPCKKFYMGSGNHQHRFSKAVVQPLLKMYMGPREMEKWKEESNRLTGTGGGKSGKRRKSGSRRIPNLVQYPINLKRAFGHMRFASHSLKTIERAEAYRKRGGIAIFDRYPQTQFPGIYDGPKISVNFTKYLDHDLFRFMARQESKTLDKAAQITPSVVFRLLVPPEISLQRKPDHDYESIRKKSEITEKLVFPLSKDYTIDATQIYAEELLTVKRIIWASLRRMS